MGVLILTEKVMPKSFFLANFAGSMPTEDNLRKWAGSVD